MFTIFVRHGQTIRDLTTRLPLSRPDDLVPGSSVLVDYPHGGPLIMKVSDDGKRLESENMLASTRFDPGDPSLGVGSEWIASGWCDRKSIAGFDLS